MSGGKVRLSGQTEYKYLTSVTVEIGDFVEAEYIANNGYDFVGWARPEAPETVIATADRLGFNVTMETVFIAVFEKHVHAPRFVSGYAPECEYSGEVNHYECTKCGRYFSDEACLNELSEEEVMIPALTHDWAAPTYAWSADYGTLTAMRVCKNDASHVEEETVETSFAITKAAGCEEDGEKTYTSAAFENEAFAVQQVTIAAPATGHRFTNYVYNNDATCTENGTETAVCGNGCGETDTRAAADSATGHTYGAPVWSWNADHGKATASFTCEKGDDTRTVTQNTTEVEVSAATATKDRVVKYTVTVVFGGKTYAAETENITVPGTATGETDQPGTPDTPSSGKCKWCGETHRGFWGGIVGFFHSILSFFAHLFGRR